MKCNKPTFCILVKSDLQTVCTKHKCLDRMNYKILYTNQITSSEIFFLDSSYFT